MRLSLLDLSAGRAAFMQYVHDVEYHSVCYVPVSMGCAPFGLLGLSAGGSFMQYVYHVGYNSVCYALRVWAVCFSLDLLAVIVRLLFISEFQILCLRSSGGSGHSHLSIYSRSCQKLYRVVTAVRNSTERAVLTVRTSITQVVIVFGTSSG